MENIHQGYYAIIPANVRYDKNIVPNAKLLYAEITALCNKTGYCWASNNYFSELYGVSKGTVSSWISSLVKAGYISVDLKYKEGKKEIESRHIRLLNVYPIHDIRDTSTENHVYPIHDIRDTSTENHVYPIHDIMQENTQISNNKNDKSLSGAQNQSPLILGETKKTKKSKDIATMRSMIAAFTQNEEIREKLTEYFSVRLKKGLQPNQWQIILDDLRKYAGTDADLAIEQINGAIAGGYMQIIADWKKNIQAKGKKPAFDNLGGKQVPSFDPKKDKLATNKDGKPIVF